MKKRHKALLLSTLILAVCGIIFPFLPWILDKVMPSFFGLAFVIAPIPFLLAITLLVLNALAQLPRGPKIAALCLSIAAIVGFGWYAVPMIMMVTGLMPPLWG